jgi:molecular chaperone DnaK
VAYRLGVDLGTTYTAAAVHADDGPEMVALGNRAMQVPSVLFVKVDGDVLVGEAAERRGVTEPARLVREFKRRVGDPVPLVVGGTPYSPQALVSRLLKWVVGVATERYAEPPEHVTVTHPANWGPFKRDLLRQAVSMSDLPAASLCTEPEAAAITYSSRNRVADGDRIAVYDLGGGTFDAAVLGRRGDVFELLGEPEGVEHLGGIDFDEAVFHHVLTCLPEGAADLDAEDSASVVALTRLRRDCVEAKEALSSDTEAIIPVVLPGVNTSVRLTRREFEEMIRPAIAETVAAMHRALRSSGTDPDDLAAIVLVGGSSRIPLVSESLATVFARPLALDTHPKHDVALGAALREPTGDIARAPVSARSVAAAPASVTAMPSPAAPPAPAPPATPPARSAPPQGPATPPSPAARSAPPSAPAAPPAPTPAPQPPAASPPPAPPAASPPTARHATTPPVVPKHQRGAAAFDAAPARPAPSRSAPSRPEATSYETASRPRHWSRSVRDAPPQDWTRRAIAAGAVLALVAVAVIVALRPWADDDDGGQAGTTASGLPKAASPLADNVIVYPRKLDDNWDVATIAADGSAAGTLASSPDSDSFPTISADRRTVIYVRKTSDTTSELRAVGTDGKGDRAVFAKAPADCPNAERPAWRSSMLAVPCTDPATRVTTLKLVAMDGTIVREIDRGRLGDPAFTPDGYWIIYWRNPRDANDGGQLVRAPADGSAEATTITDGAPRRDNDVAVSPLGDRIAFSRAGEAPGIWVSGLAGRGLQRLTTAPGDQDPTWSPDSTKIAFKRNNFLWVMDADGGNPHQVTKGSDADTAAAWTPR